MHPRLHPCLIVPPSHNRLIFRHHADCPLTSALPGDILSLQAEVAELADAMVSNTIGREVVRVQVPPSAPSYLKTLN